ncbi:MAG: rod-binding protein [Comamonadaceae bacterium]|nr:rod-binding protein [Comamonadaceae bacterium]
MPAPLSSPAADSGRQRAGGRQPLARRPEARRAARSARRDAQGGPRSSRRCSCRWCSRACARPRPRAASFDSPANDMYTGMLDQQMATRIAASGTGLADVIVRQLTRHLPAAAAAPAGRHRLRERLPPSARSTRAHDRRRARRCAHYGEIARTARAAAALPRDRSVAAAPPPGIDRCARRRLRHPPLGRRARRAARHRHPREARHRARRRSSPAGARARSAAPTACRSHNLFGIKATGGWKGRTVEVVTTEYDGRRGEEGGREVPRLQQLQRGVPRLGAAARQTTRATRRCWRRAATPQAFAARPAARRLRHRPGLRRQAGARDRQRQALRAVLLAAIGAATGTA